MFKTNSFIKINFDNIEIIRHPKHEKIYGVTLKQRWNSSNYSDEGYLFLMFDFKNFERPIIRIRSWQPEPFEDGKIVSLGDFYIIE